MEVYLGAQIKALFEIGFVRSHVQQYDKVYGSMDNMPLKGNIICYFLSFLVINISTLNVNFIHILYYVITISQC